MSYKEWKYQVESLHFMEKEKTQALCSSSCRIGENFCYFIRIIRWRQQDT